MLCLCFSLCLCIFHCGVSAVDFVVVPAFARAFDVSVLCLCIVAVYFLCHCLLCCACVLSGFICLNSQGYVCQRFYCAYLVDDLESISTQWRRDYLSAIRLLGNLFQTTLAHDDFPSNPNSPPLLSCQIPKPSLLISILLPKTGASLG